MSGAVFLTGATGFVGGELLARYLERTDRPIRALVRAPDEEQAQARLAKLVTSIAEGDEGAYEGRVVAVPGDVSTPGLGLSERDRDALADEVDEIVHAAATVSFTLPLEEARAINVEGTRRVLELAKHVHERGELSRFAHISTAYVAGTHRGRFGEGDLDRGQGYYNTYERSKREAESMLRAEADELPLQRLRPSIVVGDSRSGWTSSFNVLYWPLRAFTMGLYKAIPAKRSSPADIVPVDYVADAVLALADSPSGPDAVYNLVAGDRATNVGELIDLSAAAVDRRPPRVFPPILYRKIVHPILMRRSDARQRAALEHSEAYFPFFSSRVRFDDSRARAELDPHGLEPPPPREYFKRLIEFATATRWGKKPLSRTEALARVSQPAPA